MTKHSHENDVAFIQALAELLNKNELTEISVVREYGEDDSLEVRVAKQSTVVQSAPVSVAPPAAAPAAVAAAPVAAAVSDDPSAHPALCPRRWLAPPISQQSRARRPSPLSAHRSKKARPY